MGNALRKAATSLALIVIVAMGARIAFAWNEARKVSPGVLGIVPFQQETGNIAYALAQGRGFSDVFRTNTGPTAWLAPVYPLLVAAMFKCFGLLSARAFFSCVGLNILFSSAACVPVFYAGKKIWGLGVASGAAWLWAIFPNAIMMPFEWIWDTSLSALLAATLLWATLALSKSKRARDWCVYGLLCGVALLTNPALGALLPFLLGWAGWAVCRDCDGSRFAWKRAALAACVALLCCAPWTIRNYTVFHRLIPLRSNLPFELWLGNNDIFDEHARNGRRSITRMEEARRYTQLGETAYLQEKWQLATSFIETHPRLELQLTGRKFVAFWTGTKSPFKNFRETDSPLIKTILLSSFLSAAAGVLGMAALWRKRVAVAFPLAVYPIVFPCLYYVTHADLRYRHPIDPVVLLLAAVAVEAAWELGIAKMRSGAGKADGATE
jgi:type IV secretory pathway VirB2 component (pilin)